MSLSAAHVLVNTSGTQATEQLGSRRAIALILAALVFVSAATIKDLLPARPLAGTLHPQDVLKGFVFLAGGVVALCSSNWSLKSLVTWPVFLATLFLVWCVVTVPISTYPKSAMLGTALLAQIVTFVPYSLSQLGAIRVQRILVSVLLTFLLVTTIVYLIFPSHNLLDPSEAVRLAGLAHSNSVGQMAGLMVIAALCLYDQSRLSLKVLIALCCMALVVFVWAQSRTPGLATAAVIGLYCWRRLIFSPQSVAPLVSLACLVAIGITIALFVYAAQPPKPWEDKKSVLSRSGSSDELTTLTGRDVIWEFTLQKIARRPIAGYGYGSSPLVFLEAHQREELYLNYGSAHNLILEVALNTGSIGAALVAGSFLALLALFFTRPCLFPDLVFVFLVITGITEAVLFGPVPGPATILWLLALYWRAHEANLARRPSTRPWGASSPTNPWGAAT